ncbi:MAG: heavy metal translocating P-type ATPase metal-binding domain-containing protein [Ferruginibacter sp.]
MANTEKVKSFKQDCFHCGDACLSVIQAATKCFCCKGCKQVYLLLHENNLCNYYNPDNNLDIKAKEKFTSGRFDYLDDAAALERRVQFLSDTQLPLVSSSDFSKFAGSFLYNIGRIITYSILVWLFGLTGKGFYVFGLQQWLSITIGIIILLTLVIPKIPGLNISTNRLSAKYTTKIRYVLDRLFLNRSYSSLFAIGMLNGLLPCGLVYMALLEL